MEAHSAPQPAPHPLDVITARSVADKTSPHLARWLDSYLDAGALGGAPSVARVALREIAKRLRGEQGPVVTLSAEEAAEVREELADARSVRVMVDGGLKVSVNRRSWSPPLGAVQEGQA